MSRSSPEVNRRAQANINARKRAIVRSWKAERGCAECGESDVRCLDLHHVDPAKKHPRLRMKNGRRKPSFIGLSYADLALELAKCIVLCANCHRKHHDPKEG